MVAAIPFAQQSIPPQQSNYNLNLTGTLLGTKQGRHKRPQCKFTVLFTQA